MRKNRANGLLLAIAAAAGILSQRTYAATDTWTGATNGNWDTTTANWSNGGTNLYSNGDTVIFSGGSNPSITVQSAGVSPASTTFQSTSTNYSLTDAGATGITGTGTVTLANTYTGTVTLNSANNYSGATAINGGTLAFTSPSAMSTNSVITPASGTTINLASDTNTTFTPAASGLVLGNGGTYNFNVNQLTGAGAGKTLSIANETSGQGGSATVINVGSTSGDTLEFSTAFVPPTSSGSAFGGPATTFNLTGANVILNAGVTAGNDNGIIVASTTGNSLRINGTISTNTNRTFFTTINSGGILNLDPSNYVRGGVNGGMQVNLSGGTLNLMTAGALFATNTSNYVNSRPALVISSGTLDNTSGSSLTLTNNPLININGNFTFGAATDTSANSLNTGTGAVALSSNPTITTLGSGVLTIGGTVSGTGVSLTKTGAGTLALSGSNSYTGGTTVSNGTLIAANTTSGQSSTGTGGVTLNGGTLASASGATSYISGTVSAGSGSHSIAPGGVGTFGQLNVGGLSLNANSTLSFDINGSSQDLLNDTGSLTVTGTPTVSLTASGLTASSYTLANYTATGLSNSNFNFLSTPSGYHWNVTNSALQLLQNPTHSAVALLTNTDPNATYSAMVGTANPGNNTPSSTITLTGAGNGHYNPGYLNNISSNGNKGYITINGFTSGDAVIGALSLTVGGSAPTSAQLTQLINDLNAGATGLTAESFADLQSSNPAAYNALKNNDPNYGADPLEIAFVNSGTYSSANPTYLALDFSNENSSLGGTVLVTDIAAIPEPASLALVGLVAAAALTRRRRRKA